MGFLSRLFGREKHQRIALIDDETDFASMFSASANAEQNDIIQSCIWTNASNAGKLNPKHIRSNCEKYDLFPIPEIKRILERPNPLMGMSIFVAKMVSNLEYRNNAFALVKFDKNGYPEGLYPITYSSAEAVPVGDEYWIKFSLPDGTNLTAPYAELIHLRKHFRRKDLFGDGNETMDPLAEIVQTIDKGVISAIRRSNVVRWLLKFNTGMKPEDLKKQTDDFTKTFLSVDSTGGAAATDSKFDAQQVTPGSFVPNAAQMDKTVQRIYNYFGVNENIIQSKFSEETWNAYYENKLEPIAIQLSEEFTEKLFRPDQRSRGNKIIFEANRLQYSSNGTKVAVGTFLTNIGAITLDQVLEIFNYAPIGGDDGKRRIQTLNVINAKKADNYQLGEKNKEEEPNGGITDKTDQPA